MLYALLGASVTHGHGLVTRESRCRPNIDKSFFIPTVHRVLWTCDSIGTPLNKEVGL
jgi:hypothetical protein